MFQRTSVEKSTSVASSFEHDVKREHADIVRNSKWSKKNRYDRFAVQKGKKPIKETQNWMRLTLNIILDGKF